MTRRVVITGMGGVTAFGENWQDVSARLLAYENAVRKMPEWQVYDGLHTLLINQRRNGHCIRLIDRQYRPGKRVRHHADGKAHEQHHWHHLCADDAAHYCR